MSTVIEVTCQCGKVLRTTADNAGKRGRCKGCGTPIDIPYPEPEADEGEPIQILARPDVASAYRPTPSVAPPLIHPKASVLKIPDPDAGAPRIYSGEPWCYKILAMLANILAIISALAFIGTLIVALVGVAAIKSSESWAMVVPAMIGMVTWFLSCVVFAILSAGCYIVVDVARNIRVTRLLAQAAAI